MPLPYLISTYIIKSKNEESDISAIIKSKESVKCLSTYTDWFYKDDKKKCLELSEACDYYMKLDKYLK